MSKSREAETVKQHDETRGERSFFAALSTPERDAPPWSLLTAAFLCAALFINLVLVGPALAAILLGSQILTPQLLILGWALGMSAACVFVLLNRLRTPESRAGLRFVQGKLPTPIVALLGVAIALGLDLVISLPSGRFLPAAQIYGIDGQSAIFGALLLVAAQPLAETLVFQATLLPSLRWRLGGWGGIIATCLVYTLLHAAVFYAPWGAIYDSFWHGLAHPFLLCLALCALRLRADSSRAVLIARIAAGVVFWLAGLALTL